MKKLLSILVVSIVALVAQANPKGYIMVAIHSPGELPSPAYDINGVRFSLIYGDCQNLNGYDFGFAGRIRERMNGAQTTFAFNIVDSDFNGFELSWVNYVGGDVDGAQWGFYNYATSVAGEQRGVINIAERIQGFQGGCLAFNWADEVEGLHAGIWNGASAGFGMQYGLVNTAGYMAGVQIGLFNWANNLDGLQIGLSNVVADQACPWLPFLNAGW